MSLRAVAASAPFGKPGFALKGSGRDSGAWPGDISFWPPGRLGMINQELFLNNLKPVPLRDRVGARRKISRTKLLPSRSFQNFR
jgi:hypothetical protein